MYEEFGLGVVGIKEVPSELVPSYCTLDIEKVRDKSIKVFDMIEKPKPEELSPLAILGRCVLPASVFDILEKLPPGAGGEIQLTDAMKIMANCRE